MAQLPLVTRASVEASRQVPGYQVVDYNPDQFGAGIGRALAQTGQTFQRAAQVEKALRQDVKANNALDAENKAKTELRERLYHPTDGILAQTGGNAMGVGGIMDVTVSDIRKRYADSIADPETRAAFERRWDSTANQAQDVAARHELAQVSEFKAQTTQAVLQQGLLDTYNGYNDETSVQAARESVISAIRANTLGAPPEQVALAEQQAVSQLHMASIARWAEEDPQRALEYYEANAEEIAGADHVTATKLIMPALQMRRADENVARMVGQGGQAAGDLWSAVTFTESSNNPTAVSDAGALGISQVMPDTAREVAARLGLTEIAAMGEAELESFLTSTDPEAVAVNERLGKTYLNEQLQRYSGDVEAALVAYNAGPKAADAFLRHNAGRAPGQRDYDVPGWKGVKNESEAYVRKVLARYSASKGTTPSGRMTRDNWSLTNFKPEDLMPIQEEGHWVDARAATGLDQLATRMGQLFPGLKVSVNAGGSQSQGNRRGTRVKSDRPKGAASYSKHFDGIAFDVQTQGWTSEQKAAFITEARSLGFGGIGFYGENGHIHIDMGGDRTWGSMPDWARSAMRTPVGNSGAQPTATALGTGGTGTIPGRGAFYADIAAPDMLAWEAEAMQIADPTLRTLTLQKLAIQGARMESAAAAQTAQIKQTAWETVIAGGVEDLNPAQIAQLDPSFISSLYSYQSNRDKPGGVPNDWQKWSQISRMDPNDLIGMDVYTEFRNSLDDEHFDRVLTMQREALKAQRGDPGALELTANMRTRAQIVSGTQNLLGWKDESPELAQLNRKLDDRILLEQRAKGKELTATEIQDVVDKLLIEDRRRNWTGIMGGQGPAMAAENPREFIAASTWDEVQPDDQRQLTDFYQGFYGTEPVREEATDIYNRAMQVWLGANPTGPEEERQYVRNLIETNQGHPITDAEFEVSYGKWLLRFLGR